MPDEKSKRMVGGVAFVDAVLLGILVKDVHVLDTHDAIMKSHPTATRRLHRTDKGEIAVVWEIEVTS